MFLLKHYMVRGRHSNLKQREGKKNQEGRDLFPILH